MYSDSRQNHCGDGSMLQTQARSLEMYEDYISTVIKALREGRRGGAKEFYIICELDVDLGMMCADENDIEELMVIYGPLYWQEYDKDPGGFKKMMWCEITKEFDCKASGRERKDAFTHRHLSPGKKEATSQLDHIIGPMRRDDETRIHNEERMQHGITTPFVQRYRKKGKQTIEGREEEVDWMETKNRRANSGIHPKKSDGKARRY